MHVWRPDLGVGAGHADALRGQDPVAEGQQEDCVPRAGSVTARHPRLWVVAVQLASGISGVSWPLTSPAAARQRAAFPHCVCPHRGHTHTHAGGLGEPRRLLGKAGASTGSTEGGVRPPNREGAKAPSPALGTAASRWPVPPGAGDLRPGRQRVESGPVAPSLGSRPAAAVPPCATPRGTEQTLCECHRLTGHSADPTQRFATSSAL